MAEGTGAWVARPDERAADEVEYTATTLDVLLAGRVMGEDRGLLKLDLEGHELPALRGGARLLSVLEVVVVELRVFDRGSPGHPLFADVMHFLDGRGFELYDFACLSARRRDRCLRMGDVVFVRRGSRLADDRSKE